MVLEMKSWTTDMRRLARDPRLLQHPFFTDIQDPTRRREHLISWALQDIQVSTSFPDVLRVLLGRTTEPAVALVIEENLREELNDPEFGQSHSELFRQMLQSIGIAPPPPGHSTCLRATVVFIESQLAISRREDLFSAIASFCYANEYLSLREFPPIRRAFAKEWPTSDLRFFGANVSADGRHTRRLEQALAVIAAKRTCDADAAERAIAKSIEERLAIYDAIVSAGTTC